MPKTLLVVGAGRLQIPAILTGKRLGLRVVAVDRNPHAPGMSLADASRVVDTHDIAGIIDAARAEHAAGVVTLCTDLPVRAVAAASQELGLCALSPEAAAVATHKGLMRDAFAAAGAPIPKYRRVRSASEAQAAAASIGYPVILKPPASSGSRGIFKAERREEIEAGFPHTKTIAGDEEILVEEFVDGPEVSVETLSFRGEHRIVTITDKRTTGDPHWVETGHVEPSRLGAEVQQAIREAALRGLQALGIDNAAGHVEIKVGQQGPRLMEIGARLGGDFITTELVLRSTGVDMVEGIIRIALGEAPNWTPTQSRGAAICYLTASPGKVTAVGGTKEAGAMPGVVRLEVDVTIGDRIPVVQSSLDRPGFVIAEGRDADEAEQRAAAAAERVRLTVS